MVPQALKLQTARWWLFGCLLAVAILAAPSSASAYPGCSLWASSPTYSNARGSFGTEVCVTYRANGTIYYAGKGGVNLNNPQVAPSCVLEIYAETFTGYTWRVGRLNGCSRHTFGPPAKWRTWPTSATTAEAQFRYGLSKTDLGASPPRKVWTRFEARGLTTFVQRAVVHAR